MMNNTTQIINEFGESIVQVDGDIPIDLPAKEGDRFLFISHDQSLLTHGLHKYPCQIFPGIYHVGSSNDIHMKKTESLTRFQEAVQQMLRHFSRSAILLELMLTHFPALFQK